MVQIWTGNSQLLGKEIKKYRIKVECAFPMVILPEFHMGQYREDDHQEDAPHFINSLQVTDH